MSTATLPATTGTPGDTSAYLNQVLPGFNNAGSTAMSNIQSLLSGLPSVSATRQANAYFGAGSGTPSSDFVRNRGYDLYGQKAAANQQTGAEDLMKMIGAYSGTVTPTAGQSLQNTQFNQAQGQQASQFGQTLAEQQAALAQNQSQFTQAQGQQNTQFGQNLAQNQGQFTQAQGQQNTQFGQSLSAQAAALAQQQGQFTQAQGQQNTQFGQNLAEQQAALSQADRQFGASLNQNQGQFNQTNQLNSFEAMMQALGLGNTLSGGGGQFQIPQMTL